MKAGFYFYLLPFYFCLPPWFLTPRPRVVPTPWIHVVNDQPLDDAPVLHMIVDDLSDARYVDPAVPYTVRVDDQYGAALALIETVHFRDQHTLMEFTFFETVLQLSGGVSPTVFEARLMLAD